MMKLQSGVKNIFGKVEKTTDNQISQKYQKEEKGQDIWVQETLYTTLWCSFLSEAGVTERSVS